jgi:hypothetical protein
MKQFENLSEIVRNKGDSQYTKQNLENYENIIGERETGTTTAVLKRSPGGVAACIVYVRDGDTHVFPPAPRPV